MIICSHDRGENSYPVSDTLSTHKIRLSREINRSDTRESRSWKLIQLWVGTRKTGNIGSIGWDLRSLLIWCLYFSIEGSALVVDPISIVFCQKRWQKLAKKMYSLFTHIFWAKIKCCKFAIKDKSICNRSIEFFTKGKFVLNLI